MKLKKAFTLAEVLITLGIIGVVAAISVPSVVSNSQQSEYKTGLRKAVSVINQAITLNMVTDGETPYDNGNLFGFLQKNMAITRTFADLRSQYYVPRDETYDACNAAFYTTDGMRFEFYSGWNNWYPHKLYEDDSVTLLINTYTRWPEKYDSARSCGSYGLNSNTNGTTSPPCLLMVDVNGDRKPNPGNVDCKTAECGDDNIYKYSDPDGLRLTDVFLIMVTEKEAMPYGVAAQRAMYSAQSN